MTRTAQQGREAAPWAEVPRLAIWLLLAALALAVVGTLGAIGDVEALCTWGVEDREMRSVTAVCLLLGALAALGSAARRPGLRTAGKVLAGLTILVGLVDLVASAAGADLGGRASPTTAVALILIGAAVWFGADEVRGRRRLGAVAAMLAIGLAVVGLVGIAFGVDGLFGVEALDGTALPSALGILALAVGTLVVRPDEGPAALLLDVGAGGRVVRTLLPVTLLWPVALALVLFLPRDRGLLDPSAADALFVSASLLLPAVLVLVTAHSVRRLHLEREHALSALERERRFLEAVLESVSEGVVACNADSDLVIVNRSLRALHHLPQEGPPREGWAIWDQLRGPDGESPMPVEELPLVRALAGLEVREREATVVDEEGGRRTVLASGRPVTDRSGEKLGAVVSLRDVTERRQVDEALRRSWARFRALSLQAPVGIYEIDAGGACLFVNDAWAAMAGLSEADALAGGWEQAIHPDDREGVLAAWRATARRREVFTGDFRLRAPDGRVTWVHGQIRPLAGPGGEVAGWIGVNTDVTDRRRDEIEQAALRRIATAVAGDGPQADVLEMVAEEAARALEVEAACVVRFGTDSTVAGTWSAPGLPALAVGAHVPSSDSAAARVRLTGRRARIDDHRTISSRSSRAPWALPPWRSSMAAPIRVGSGTWGAIAAATTGGRAIAPGSEERLERFAALLALAIATADARSQLESLASTDHLTGLPNRRAFYERLMSEAERARRHGRALSLVVLDVDHFKDVNDTHGHEIGDRVLGEVASRLAAEARVGEVMARVGGEEFAWILPDADALGAYLAAERARRAVSAAPFSHVGGLTVSAGVCDLAQAHEGAELFRLADLALYWAKANGRNATFRYSPDVSKMLSAESQARRLARAQAIGSIRGLAQAVDGKDPNTQRHSERVADLAERLAVASGWTADRAALLHQAGLVHDVGKVGVSDAILQKPGPLDPGEFARVRQHPVVGAQIVAEALTDEQTDWVRHHHERVDGRGYPDGVSGEAFSAGARLLSLADAWDAMTSDRSYRRALTPEEALAECRRQIGRQFGAEAVDALERLRREGALPDLARSPA